MSEDKMITLTGPARTIVVDAEDLGKHYETIVTLISDKDSAVQTRRVGATSWVTWARGKLPRFNADDMEYRAVTRECKVLDESDGVRFECDVDDADAVEVDVYLGKLRVFISVDGGREDACVLLLPENAKKLRDYLNKCVQEGYPA